MKIIKGGPLDPNLCIKQTSLCRIQNFFSFLSIIIKPWMRGCLTRKTKFSGRCRFG